MQKKKIVAPVAAKQKKHIIPFRVSEEEYILLNEVAASQCRSVSGLIRFVLKDVLLDYQQTKDQSIK